jgi:hypothetical protein
MMRVRRWSAARLTKGSTSPGPLDADVSPDGRMLYVKENAAHAVGVFAVHGGDLPWLLPCQVVNAICGFLGSVSSGGSLAARRAGGISRLSGKSRAAPGTY